jgi:hypothetical protein
MKEVLHSKKLIRMICKVVAEFRKGEEQND